MAPFGGTPRNEARDAGATSIVASGRYGSDVVREAAERADPAAPAEDDESPAEGQPAAQGRQLIGLRVDASTSCQTRRSSADQASIRVGQVGNGQRHDHRRLLVLEGGEVEGSDDLRPVLGDDPDRQLTGVVDRDGDLLAQQDLPAAREHHFELLAERGRLGVQDPGLVGRAVELDGGRVTGPTLAAALEPDLAADRRPAVDEVDLDRDPRADAGMSLEEDPGRHRRWIGGQRSGRSRSGGGKDQQAGRHETSEDVADPLRRVTGHGHSSERETGLRSLHRRPGPAEKLRPARSTSLVARQPERRRRAEPGYRTMPVGVGPCGVTRA